MTVASDLRDDYSEVQNPNAATQQFINRLDQNPTAEFGTGSTNSQPGQTSFAFVAPDGTARGGAGYDVFVVEPPPGGQTINASGNVDEIIVLGGNPANIVQQTPAPGFQTFNVFTGNGDDVLQTAGAGSRGVFGGGNDVVRSGTVQDGQTPTQSQMTLANSPNTPSWWDEAYYLANNADVAQAIQSGIFTSGYQHFEQFGAAEQRNPNAYFNAEEYLAANKDVAAAVAQGIFKSAFEHYVMFGAAENRNPSDDFSSKNYLDRWQDVEDAVKAGVMTAGEHAVFFGATEKRVAGDVDVWDGGEGDDILDAGRGDDDLTGGPGRDTFVFRANSDHDIIRDFEKGQDTIQTIGLNVTAASLVAGVTENADGNAVITLSDGNTITLVGVKATDVTADMFDIQP